MDNKNTELINRPKAFDNVHACPVSFQYLSNKYLKDEIVFASTTSWGKSFHCW